VLNHCITKLGALHFVRAFHQAGEVIRHGLAADGAVHALDDQIGGFDSAQVAQHHLARQNH
jgi:hypothetical protein